MKKLSILFKPGFIGDVLSLIAGALLPLAFAPFGIYTLAIISPAILLASWLWVSPRRAFVRGLLFGLGFYNVGASWIFISLHTYGYASVGFAGFATFLFILLFAVYSGIQGWFLNRFYPTNTLSKLLLAFPGSWVILEWIKSWLFTGFPWLFLGYSQINSPLRGLAPIVGVYGISLAVVFTSAVLVALSYFNNLRWRLFLIGSTLTLWLISAALSHIHWTHPQNKILKVSLVQGDIKQEIKWKPERIQEILNLYQSMTIQHWDSDIIIWPEAAVTILNVDAKKYLAGLDQDAKSHHSAVLTGIPIYTNRQYYNGVIAVGNAQGMYLKRHLVPFGEYVPLRSILKIFSQYVQIPMGDFSKGPQQQPLIRLDGIPIANFICYEIAYANEVLPLLPQAQLLVTVTDDSWFDQSIASAQHLEMAQMRALETGRYLLFSTNNGITAIIDSRGKLQSTAPKDQPYVLTGTALAMTGSTPLVIIGIYPIILLSFLFLLIAKSKRNKP